MRLLFASSIRTWGGGEEWMLSAARGLRDRGHAVRIAAPPLSALAERALESSLPVHPVRFRADADLISFWRVFGACRRHRVQAMVLNMDRVLRVGGSAARLAGVPVVLPRRGSEFPLKDGALYRITYRHVASGVIVNSRATERTLIRDIAWRPAGRIHVLPNHLDVERFAVPKPRSPVRDALGIPEDALVAIVVGELTARKDSGLLVRALPGLVADGLDLHVLLAGAGREEPRWREMARALGVADRVRFLGFRRDVPELLAASDVLVHPARVEGFGYAVAEAMAAGLPVVAANASSIPEIVRDGETGRLFPPGDLGALTSALRSYLDDAELRLRHGERGRERVRREFALPQLLTKLERVLQMEIDATTRG